MSHILKRPQEEGTYDTWRIIAKQCQMLLSFAMRGGCCQFASIAYCSPIKRSVFSTALLSIPPT